MVHSATAKREKKLLFLKEKKRNFNTNNFQKKKENNIFSFIVQRYLFQILYIKPMIISKMIITNFLSFESFITNATCEWFYTGMFSNVDIILNALPRTILFWTKWTSVTECHINWFILKWSIAMLFLNVDKGLWNELKKLITKWSVSWVHFNTICQHKNNDKSLQKILTIIF